MKDLKKNISMLTDDLRVEKHTIQYNNYDLDEFASIMEHNARIKKTHTDGIKKYPQFKELHEDLFNALFKYDPKKVPESRIDHMYALNSKVMDAVLESDKYKELRNLTRLDKLASTVGTEVLGDLVNELIEKLKEEFEKEIEAMKKAAQDAQEAKDALDGANDKDRADAEISYEEAKKKLEEYMQQVHKPLDKTQKREVNKMMEEVINEARETSDMIANWGLEQDPTYSTSSYQDKIKLLERLRSSRKLKEIADLAGRYKRMAMSAQREKVKKGVDAVYDIKPGNEIGKMLPSEAMKLANPTYRTMLKKDLLEGNVLTYEYSGNEKKHKGPIICCIDSSGSMSGQPEIWAKSVAMGLLEIARSQKRSFVALHFESGPKSTIHVNMFLRTSPYNINEIIDFAEYFAGGGTMFEPPLELAQDKINEDGEFTKADIVFITDGASAVRDKWLADYQKWKKAKNVTIYSVLIDVYYNSIAALKGFSDYTHHLKSIRKDSADDLAMTLFTSI